MVEPVDKVAMCHRELDHDMPHRAVAEFWDGKVTYEWVDPWRIRQMLADAEEAPRTTSGDGAGTGTPLPTARRPRPT